MDRRAFLSDLAGASALLLLVGHPASAQALTGSAAEKFKDLLKRSDELSGLLRAEALTDSEWRTGLDDLFRQVPLDDLLSAIDFERMRAETGYAEKGVSTARLRSSDGSVRTLNFFSKLFAIDAGRAIIPHGHTNMVSAHMILGGRMRLRQYDQLERSSTDMLVRPSIDRIIGAGELSSIGEVQENVHWFLAEAPSHTLDFIVTGLDPDAAPSFDIFNLDMDAAHADPSGNLRVPVLDVETALRKYG